MSGSHDTQEPTSVVVEAVVIRADGSREELGEVAFWHKSWVRRVIYRLRTGR